MPSHPRYFLALPVTAALVGELKGGRPSATVLIGALRVGADPFERLPSGESVFRALTLKAPDPEVLDAWFAAAGQLDRAEWGKVPNPLDDVLPVDGFSVNGGGPTASLLRRLHQAGMDLTRFDTPEAPLMARALSAVSVSPESVVDFLLHTYPDHPFALPVDAKSMAVAQNEGLQDRLFERANPAPAPSRRFKP